MKKYVFLYLSFVTAIFANADLLNSPQIKQEDFNNLQNYNLIGSQNLLSNDVYQELLDILIKYGNNPDGLPALHYGIKMQDLEAVSLLLEYGADVNTRDAKLNRTPIHIASETGNIDLINFLLDKGADILTVDVNGMNVFHYAVLSDNAKVIHLLKNNIVDITLLNALAKEFPKCGYNDMSPLAEACLLSKQNAIQALVECGANINEENHFNGSSLLSWAAYNCNIETIRFLINHGAKHNYKHNSDCNSWKMRFSPICIGANSGNLEALKLFIEQVPKSFFHEDEITIIFSGAIERKADVSTSFNLNEKLECLQLLIDNGYFTKKGIIDGIINGDFEILEYLINKKLISVNDQFNGSSLAIFFLHSHDEKSFQKNYRIIELLIEKGLDVNANGLLFIAVNSYDEKAIEFIKLFVENGANINAQDKSKRTPLFYAKDDNIRKYLISLGAHE